MRTVDFKRVVTEVVEAYALTEQELATRLGCSQQTVSRLRKGIGGDPAYGLGAKLVAMHDARPLLKGGSRK